MLSYEDVPPTTAGPSRMILDSAIFSAICVHLRNTRLDAIRLVRDLKTEDKLMLHLADFFAEDATT
jgi:hypothetical protein